MKTRLKSSDRQLILRSEKFVHDRLRGEATGHGYWHAIRVRNLSNKLAAAEGADELAVSLAALLHDVEDVKFSRNPSLGPETAFSWLTSIGANKTTASHVAEIIANLSYKGAEVEEKADVTLETLCVRDADRLDSVGAIGLARTFAYGGKVGRPIHDPNLRPLLASDEAEYRGNTGTSVNHFYEKLLLLKERIATDTGRKIAERRHKFLLSFLEEFHAEWDLSSQLVD